MTQQETEFVRWCVANDIHRFYVWIRWKQVRQQVLKMDHNECQRCREHHRYTAATTVHHVNYVKRHPEMALDIWYEWHGVKKRNLISLCHECHEAVHGYRKPQKQEPLTEERWD
ncbi:MAG: NinG protein [Bacteriophage sp.]|jgi:5-methylcytosine-specific restriction protein A|nr:MAG: NinG protein [Bacteriophage sp.]UWI37456.1 MAG: NinG protein [Bacteriophage sp.]